MKIVTKSKTRRNVNSALHAAVSQMNGELEDIGGIITKLECEIYVIPSGAYVSIMVVINGDEKCHKEILGINVRGINRSKSTANAAKKLNELLKGKKGEVVDMYSKTAVTLPGRVYTTIIAAVNCGIAGKKSSVNSASERREIIKKALVLLDNNPNAINIARVAEIFEISRSIVYRDLEALGFDRVGETK